QCWGPGAGDVRALAGITNWEVNAYADRRDEPPEGRGGQRDQAVCGPGARVPGPEPGAARRRDLACAARGDTRGAAGLRPGRGRAHCLLSAPGKPVRVAAACGRLRV